MDTLIIDRDIVSSQILGLKVMKIRLILAFGWVHTDFLLNLILFEDFEQLMSNVLSAVAAINFRESQELRAEEPVLVLIQWPVIAKYEVIFLEVHASKVGEIQPGAAWKCPWLTELSAAQKFKSLLQAACKDLA